MNRIFIFLFLSLFINDIFGQTYPMGTSEMKFAYTHEVKPWKNDTTTVKEKFVLLTNKKASNYFTENRLHKKLILQKDDVTTQISSWRDISEKINELGDPIINDIRISKNYTGNKIKVVHGYDFCVNIEFIETVNQFSWKITNESKIILGYSCFKAEATYGYYKIIAWFTPEIPISDGPYVFGGLPGLIVTLYDECKIHEFQLTSVEKYDKYNMSLLDFGGINKSHYNLKNIEKQILRKRKLLEAGYDLQIIGRNEAMKRPLKELPLMKNTSEENIKHLKLKYSLYDNLLLKFYDLNQDL